MGQNINIYCIGILNRIDDIVNIRCTFQNERYQISKKNYFCIKNKISSFK